MDESKIIGECSIQLSRSSGPGGQHVNKVNTRVQVFFDINSSEAFTLSEKNRLLKKLKTQLIKDSILSVVDQSSRSQSKNKASAFKKLLHILAEGLVVPKRRVPTKKSFAKKKETLKTKRIRSTIKKLRGPVNPTDS